jgi:Cu/Zn superoxide dismutase
MMKRMTILLALVASLATAGPANAQEQKFEAELTGAAERPNPVDTEGVGDAKFESDGTSVEFELKWDDLSTPAFAAHIHCGGVEEAGPVGVTLFAGPPRDTEGEVTGSFTGPDPGNACGWQDLDDVLAAMESGDAYVNVHTTQFRGGEIRGQVTAE